MGPIPGRTAGLDVTCADVTVVHHSLSCDYDVEIILLLVKCLTAMVTEIKKSRKLLHIITLEKMMVRV